MRTATTAVVSRRDRTVGLWTPSSPAPALFPKRMARAVAELSQLGWEVVTAPSTYAISGPGAAPAPYLAEELHGLLDDPKVDFVLATAGGYTADLVLRYLDYQWIAEQEKPIVGYSDVSNVLWALYTHGVGSLIHGPMAVSEFGHWTAPFPYTVDSLVRTLAGEYAGELVQPDEWTDDDPWWDRDDERALLMKEATPWRALRHGTASGWLLAGCMLSVRSAFGGPYLPETDGAVLFLEDFGVGPDQVCAMLNQWRQSGRLSGLAGAVFGRRARPQTAASGFADFDEAILQVFDGIDIPIVADVDFGHTEPQLSLPLGASVLITTDPVTIELAGGKS
ncbi:S66 peptidase family protein [Streptomyces sp. CA-251387]|uniref:S66 peptidase family protein n=1 Tax=Streptomyces sp. CA-251387 TaxID=3240064 RepID=UPI003D8F0458